MLHGPELEIERYVNLRLTRSQKGDIANHREGDVPSFIMTSTASVRRPATSAA